jgi:hypothetical protein
VPLAPAAAMGLPVEGKEGDGAVDGGGRSHGGPLVAPCPRSTWVSTAITVTLVNLPACCDANRQIALFKLP